MNKLWFLGGIVAAVAIVVAGLGIAQAAIKPAPTNTVAPACGCANHAQCGGGCAAMAGTGACGCQKK